MKIALSKPNQVSQKAMFTNAMDQIFEKYPDVLRYAKDLDAYSSTTFHHSANVAFHMHDTLSKSETHSKEEVLEWTAAAFVHDAGKFTTPLDLLHSKEKFRNDAEKEVSKDDSYAIMMEHSINGYEFSQKYDFTPTMQLAVIGHHIDAKAIDNGPENGFKGASESRKTWDKSFPDNYIEKTLCKNFSWVTEKDKKALEFLTIFDMAEAMRSTERMYNQQQAVDWNAMLDFFQKDVSKGKIDASIADLFTNESVRNNFDDLQQQNIFNNVRYLVAEKGQDIPFHLSADKIEEIKATPSLGEAFLKDGDLSKIISGEMDIEFQFDLD